MSLSMPEAVATAFDAMPEVPRATLLAARAAIFETAEASAAGALTETLKWGRPAYLTEATKSGSTLRLGVLDGRAAMFFNCNTSLVDGFRSDLPEAFEYVGNRALMLGNTYDPAALRHCVCRALTYHRDKRKGRR